MGRVRRGGPRRGEVSRRHRGLAPSVMAPTLKRPGPSTTADTDSVLLREMQPEDKMGLPRDGGTEARLGWSGRRWP